MSDDGCGCSVWGLLLLALGGIMLFIGLLTGDTGAGLVAFGLIVSAVGTFLLIRQAAAQPGPPAHDQSEPSSASHDTSLTQTPSKHSSPRPSGDDYEPWQPATRMRPVVGEFYRQQAHARLAQQLGLPADGTRAAIDLAVDLALDPANPYARHGAAISVWAEGQHVAFIADDDVPDYVRPLEQLHADGKHLTIRARLHTHYDTKKRLWRPSLTIQLPDPQQILPPSDLPPGAVEIIPAGRVIQVIGEENHLDFLSTIVDPDGPTDKAATLRTAQMGTRSIYNTVQVLIDGEPVGTFSRAIGEQTHALVKLIEDAGLVPVVRATVEGNSLHVEVKVRMQRSAEFSDARIQQLRQIARERRANSNRRGEPFEWDDEGLSSRHDVSSDRENRQ